MGCGSWPDPSAGWPLGIWRFACGCSAVILGPKTLSSQEQWYCPAFAAQGDGAQRFEVQSFGAQRFKAQRLKTASFEAPGFEARSLDPCGLEA